MNKTVFHFRYASLLLSAPGVVQSCMTSRMPPMLNCSKQGKGGVWVEAETSDSTLTTYAVSRYKNGERQGRHYAYRRTPAGLMWRCEQGRYHQGRKAGLWLYYTTCGDYINWVYYWGGQQIHARVINSTYALRTCACEGQ
jgi:hypothetical protein